MLMLRGVDRLLRTILPGGGAVTFKMGFAGPQYRRFDETPNYEADAFTLANTNELADVAFNEGGADLDDKRALCGYERQDVSFSQRDDGYGAIVDSDRLYWDNQVGWEQHGDWTPIDWDEDVQGEYPQPWPWWGLGCLFYEQGGHAFPWCTPLIHEDWYEDNEFSADCESCSQQWGVNNYPQGLAFLTVHQSGYDPEICFVSRMAAPTHYRFGSRISGRYFGRFGGPGFHRDFVRAIARRIGLGEAMPWGTWKVALLSTATTSIGPTALDSDVELALAELKNVPGWTVTPYSEGVTPNAAMTAPAAWTHSGETAVTVRTVAIVADSLDPERTLDLLCWQGLSEAKTLEPGDTFTLDSFTLELAEVTGKN